MRANGDRGSSLRARRPPDRLSPAPALAPVSPVIDLHRLESQQSRESLPRHPAHVFALGSSPITLRTASRPKGDKGKGKARAMTADGSPGVNNVAASYIVWKAVGLVHEVEDELVHRPYARVSLETKEMKGLHTCPMPSLWTAKSEPWVRGSTHAGAAKCEGKRESSTYGCKPWVRCSTHTGVTKCEGASTYGCTEAV